MVYIGKAGSIRHDGWSSQKLSKRLSNRQGDVAAGLLGGAALQAGLTALRIHWWVTFDERNIVLPGTAEGEMMQAYFDEFSGIPILNRSF